MSKERDEILDRIEKAERYKKGKNTSAMKREFQKLKNQNRKRRK